MHPRWPLVIAANRDEFEQRASSGPQALNQQPLVIGGRDEVAGGTWLAVSERRFVVAVANRRDAGKHDPMRRSRGNLVLETARMADVAGVRRFMKSVDPREYNPFIFVCADARAGFVAHGADDGTGFVEITPGAHAVTNWELDSDVVPKAARAKLKAREAGIAGIDDPTRLVSHLRQALSDHAEGPGGLDGGLCVHRPKQHYGTRSSWIILLGAQPESMGLYYIEGHPCEGTLSDVTHLLRGVSARSVEVQ